MNRHNWWQHIDPAMQESLKQIWLPVGLPGHAGDKKAAWKQALDDCYGEGLWRIGYYVRGRIVSQAEALQEYEQGYRVHLHHHPEIVKLLVTLCGNVYDD